MIVFNPGIAVMKNKFDKAVDAINSGVDETKVACRF